MNRAAFGVLMAQMLSGRRSYSHDRVALIRDVVEICALLAAGIWAIYVFIYTDRIQPFQKPLTLVVTNAVQPIGAKGNLLAVQLQESIRNDGQTDVRLLADAQTLVGRNLGAPATKPLDLARSSAPLIVISHAALPHADAVVYASAVRYRGTTPRAGNYYAAIAPGETWRSQQLIYVPRGRYDSLELWSVYMVTKYFGNAIPLAVQSNPSGVLFFPSPAGCDVFLSFTTVTQNCPEQITASNSLSLWARL